MAETLRGSVHESPVRQQPHAQKNDVCRKLMLVEAGPPLAPLSERRKSAPEAWESASLIPPLLPKPHLWSQIRL